MVPPLFFLDVLLYATVYAICGMRAYWGSRHATTLRVQKHSIGRNAITNKMCWRRRRRQRPKSPLVDRWADGADGTVHKQNIGGHVNDNLGGNMKFVNVPILL